MLEWQWLAISFLVIAALAYAVLATVRWLMVPPVMPRLDVTEDELEARQAPGAMTRVLAGQLPTNAAEESELSAELRNAGYYRPDSLIGYLAVRGSLVILPLLATVVVALLVPSEQLWRVFLIGAIATILGFGLPRVFLLSRTRWRRREIERALPLSVDLLRLCLSAGQTLIGSLKQVSRELRHSHPILASEMAIAARHAEVHSLTAALQQWADRTPLPEVRNLALILIQSERLGTDVTSTLREFATHYRTTLRLRAETRANRVSFWMLIPSVFCLWTASAIILIGPAYQEFLSHTQRTPALFEKARRDIDRINRRPGDVGQAATTTTTANPNRPVTP